jgi:hypothetical protein
MNYSFFVTEHDHDQILFYRNQNYNHEDIKNRLNSVMLVTIQFTVCFPPSRN